MKKSGPRNPPPDKGDSADTSLDLAKSSSRFLASIPAQIDAIKAEREQRDRELRRSGRPDNKKKDKKG